jgi:hypothetical protein
MTVGAVFVQAAVTVRMGFAQAAAMTVKVVFARADRSL